MADIKKELHNGKVDNGAEAVEPLKAPSLKRTNHFVDELNDSGDEEWFDEVVDDSDEADSDCSEADGVLGEERLPNQINLSRAVDNRRKMAPGDAAARLYEEIKSFNTITERLSRLPQHQKPSFYSMKGNESSLFSFDEKNDNRGIAKIGRSLQVYKKKLDKLIVKKTTDPEMFDDEQKERRL